MLRSQDPDPSILETAADPDPIHGVSHDLCQVLDQLGVVTDAVYGMDFSHVPSSLSIFVPALPGARIR